MKENTETHWVGMDVSKATFDVALACSGQHFPSTPLRTLPWRSFARTEAGVAQFLAWLDEQLPEEELPQVRGVMEATGNYSIELTAWLVQQHPGLAPAIENPARTKAFIDSLGQRNRTDGMAARGLAFYGAERHPAPYEPLTPECLELHTLSRCRDTLVNERTALKNRAHERCSSSLVRTIRKRRLKQLDRDIAKLEQEMKRIVDETPTLKSDFGLLVSIPGVGPITAMVVLAEVGDLRRFKRARQLSAYVGVSPRVWESGTSVHHKTRLCKQGNPRVRQALFLSAMAAVNTKSPNCLNETYRRLCLADKPGKAALGAVMRKQLVLMRALLISGKPYDPLWKTQRPNQRALAT